jgi:hypothetical protein
LRWTLPQVSGLFGFTGIGLPARRGALPLKPKVLDAGPVARNHCGSWL